MSTVSAPGQAISTYRSTYVDTLLTGSTALNTTLSPSVKAALKDAPPEDVARFSEAALQLQQAGGLFQTPGTNNSGANLGYLIQSLGLAQDATPTDDAAAHRLAAFKGYIEGQQSQGLFGTDAASVTSFLG